MTVPPEAISAATDVLVATTEPGPAERVAQRMIEAAQPHLSNAADVRHAQLVQLAYDVLESYNRGRPARVTIRRWREQLDGLK